MSAGTRTRNGRRARNAVVALAASLLCLVGAARTESGEATDAAFGALLAMPGAQPREGGWIIPQEPAQSEADLIAQLRQLKKEGANFNAVRHRGTLLAHAIRAGKEGAAIWLLRNGADPVHVQVSEGNTAYDLAVRYKRTRVAEVLSHQYGFEPRPPAAAKPVAPRTPTQAPPAPASREQEAENLVDQLAAAPVPDEASQRQWRAFAATLSQDQYQALFRNGKHLDSLVRLTRNIDGALEDALSRLPLDVVRANAQEIANLLMQFSFFSYQRDPDARSLDSSVSWPALWKRIDRPLDYKAEPGLAGRVSPALWPGLFASGYTEHDAAATGCLLGGADLAAFRALWPDFQRYFVDAREEAAGLVLGKYRLGGDGYPCNHDSGPAQSVAKLAFLQQQGVANPVTGLRRKALEQAEDPVLLAMASSLAPRTPAPPRLVQAALRCKPLFDETLLDALIQAPNDASVPSNRVQAIDVPGHDRCGWVVGGDTYAAESTDYDDFFNGPGREGSTRCADLPDQLNIWVWDAGSLHPMMKEALREGGVSLRQVRDVQTGKLYLLTEGKEGARCSMHYGLPQAYEWQDGAGGPRLQLSGDDRLVVRLLLAQCEESDPSDPLACRGIASLDVPEETPEAAQPVADALQEGHGLPIDRVVDWLGNARRKAYAAAIAAHDHAALGRLLAQGLPARWTAEEIRAVGASTLALEEKRRRIALLLADPGQLARALQSDQFGLPDTLVPWLPDQDWAPVLHVIGRSADLWRPAASELRASAVAASRPALACAIDHAQGYLCGGGIEPN